MRKLLILFSALSICFLISVSCNKETAPTIPEENRPTDQEESAPANQEGVIYGTVIENYGDYMPIITPEKISGQGSRPVGTELYVYNCSDFNPGNNITFSLYSMPDYFAKTESDENGSFNILLPPGKYYILILDRGILRTNLDEYCKAKSYTVESGEALNITLIIDNTTH